MSKQLHHPELLRDIEAFIKSQDMGASYFGKAAVGNSELVKRLRDGKRIFQDTEERVRAFIRDRSPSADTSSVEAAE